MLTVGGAVVRCARCDGHADSMCAVRRRRLRFFVGPRDSVVPRRQRLSSGAGTAAGTAGTAAAARTGGTGTVRTSRALAASTRAGALFLSLRRERPAHGRREEPARDEDRRRGHRVLHVGRAGRHRAHGQVHGGQTQRLQRGGGPQEAGLPGRRAPSSAPLLTPRDPTHGFLFFFFCKICFCTKYIHY